MAFLKISPFNKQKATMKVTRSSFGFPARVLYAHRRDPTSFDPSKEGDGDWSWWDTNWPLKDMGTEGTPFGYKLKQIPPTSRMTRYKKPPFPEWEAKERPQGDIPSDEETEEARRTFLDTDHLLIVTKDNIAVPIETETWLGFR